MRRILDLLALLRTLNVRDAIALLQLPDFKDAAEFRPWCRRLVRFGNGLADLTATELDDMTVEAFDSIVEDDEAFAGFHVLLVTILDASDNDDDFVVSSTDAKAIGGKVGIPIPMIISVVLMVLQFIRQLRG